VAARSSKPRERVFAKEGEAGLSIRRFLAEEIDYSPSAIYKYFGSKEDDRTTQGVFLRTASWSRLSAKIFPAGRFAPSPNAAGCVTTYIRHLRWSVRHHYFAAAFSNVQGAPVPVQNKGFGGKRFFENPYRARLRRPCSTFGARRPVTRAYSTRNSTLSGPRKIRMGGVPRWRI